MRHWTLALTMALAVGCASAAPQAVQDACAHQLEDFALLEAELLPLVPDAAVIEFTTLTGETKMRPARTLWQERIRAFLFRGAALLAWSRGETFDPEAAFAKLFPDRVAEDPGP